MSNNYHLKTGPRSTLPPELTLHVGRSANGMAFLFQAYDFSGKPASALLTKLSEKGHPEIYCTMSYPLVPAFKISSWAEWKLYLLAPGSQLEDERGKPVNIQEFITWIEASGHPKRGTAGVEHNTVKSNIAEALKNSEVLPENFTVLNWVDAEGYEFSLENFC